MREILFRGRGKSGFYAGKFVFGYYVKDFWHKGCCGIQPNNEEQGGYVEVDPETVGQYTGLTDKNGKKIFEGDILDCGDRVVFVKWHDYCGTWDCDFIKYKGEQCSNGVTPAEWKYRAVIIGNIHDNPELLKGGE